MRLGRTFVCVLLVSVLFVAFAWPGAATRGVIAEEVQPYLHRYPRLIDNGPTGVTMLPPNDAPEGPPRFVGSEQWPELGWNGKTRLWPLFVRGHQTAIGTYVGIALGPLLGGGIAGVRRSTVLFALSLVILTFAFARRLGLSRGWSTATALGLALSPGFWFFARTGYGFELASRVFMGACLLAAAPLEKIDRRRGAWIALFFGLAVLSRVTIVTTMVPALLLMLFHPKRSAGPRSNVAILAAGSAVYVIVVGLALATLPFGPSPGQNLRISALAGRTIVALPTLAVQLAWVVDPRVILAPLVRGDLHVELGFVRAAIGSVVVIAALVRWWKARATEGERLFVASLLGNALFGAWLYGDPGQFQLGMCLEPLFVLAVAGQLAALPEIARFLGGALVLARVATLVSLARTEKHADNPMLAGDAQRSLIEELQAKHIEPDQLLTTSYDHVGMIEAWTDERYRPIHAWRILRVAGQPEDRVVEEWRSIFALRPACHVLVTTAPNLFAGSFTDNALVIRGLQRFATEKGFGIATTRIHAASGREIFQLLDLEGCR